MTKPVYPTMPLSRTVRQKKFLAFVVIAFYLLYLISHHLHEHLCLSSPFLASTSYCSPGIRDADFNLFYHLGGNGPWIPKVNGLGDAEDPLPEDCNVEQAHMLARHAERYPTRNAGRRHLTLLERLHGPGIILKGSLSFLKTWSYFTDPADPAFENLTTEGPYAGTLQAFRAGQTLRRRYNHLVPTDRSTRFWSCSSERDVETAMYFADGFFGAHWSKDGLAELHIIPESADRGADTLTPGDTCSRYRTDAYGHDYGYHQLEIWQKTFAPAIAQRLSRDIVGLTLSPLDIYSMMEMCGFEILARGFSSWCNVFSHGEWLEFEYARDLLHFYRAGPGNQFAPAMGWLWLNATTELLSNVTSNDIYFSFVHDGDIIPLLAALQILDEKTIIQDLPTDHVKDNRRWRTSDVVPMGGRVILERVACGSGQRKRRYVRIFVNDGLMRMAGIPATKEIPYGIRIEDFQNFVSSRLDLYGDFREVCELGPEAPSRISFLHQ